MQKTSALYQAAIFPPTVSTQCKEQANWVFYWTCPWCNFNQDKSIRQGLNNADSVLYLFNALRSEEFKVPRRGLLFATLGRGVTIVVYTLQICCQWEDPRRHSCLQFIYAVCRLTTRVSQTRDFLQFEAKWNVVYLGPRPIPPLGLWPRWMVIKWSGAESALNITSVWVTFTLFCLCVFFHPHSLPYVSSCSYPSCCVA